MLRQVAAGAALSIGLVALQGLQAAPSPAAGQGLPDGTIQFPIAPVASGGVKGVVLLRPSTDGGTAVQVLVAQAPQGTVAVIHPGTCEAIDPSLVALLGDVGTGASLQVTIPIEIGSLADGAHALALYEDIGFATTLACGTIPATGPGPAPELSAQPTAASDVGTYSSPRYGFSVTWDPTWQRVDDPPPEGVDRITLDDGLNTIQIAGYHSEAGDAASCVAAWEDSLFAGVRDGSVGDLAPLQGADGTRVAGGDAAHAWAAYSYLHQPLTTETADYRECWSLADGTMVELGHVAFIDDYEAGVLGRQAIVATLVLPDVPAPASQGPEVVPAPEEVPSPEVVPPEDVSSTEVVPPPEDVPPEDVPPPEATLDPACDGVPAWVDATRGRLDRIVDLQTEADAFVTDGDVDGYVASVGRFAGEVRELLAGQQSDLVPDLALSANEDAIETFGHYIDAGETLYSHIKVAASTGTYQRFLDAIGAANEGAGSVRTQLGELSGRCP